MNLQEAALFCRDTALRAGEAILQVYGSEFAVDTKADSSPLTQADLAANRIIVDALHSRYPEAAILSEETRDDGMRRQNPLCFIVDPLDGTKEFVKRNGQFTVNIALARASKSVLGVVYAPVTDTVYVAWEGGGAHKGKGGGALSPIHVTDKTARLILVGSKSHSSEKESALQAAHAGSIAEVVSVGSSLKGCMVAEGSADLYYRFGPTCEWDTAAMQCVVEEAGGIFREMDGSEMRYNRADTLNAKGFFAVNRTDNIWV